jgi:hypothetical protein
VFDKSPERKKSMEVLLNAELDFTAELWKIYEPHQEILNPKLKDEICPLYLLPESDDFIIN